MTQSPMVPPPSVVSPSVTRPAEIQSFSLGVRGVASVGREEIEALVASAGFRGFADLMPDPMLIVDPDETVIFLSAAARTLAGRSTLPERVPFSLFLRKCDLDMDAFVAAAERGQNQGSVRVRSSGRVYHATRRVLMAGGHTRGYSLYWLRDPDGWERMKRSGQSRVLSRSEVDGGRDLSFPPSLALQLERARRAYGRGFRVLLLGESGVGKTEIARHIHLSAGDGNRPFIHVNCGSVPETLFESEMFGYERGAFTGALQAGKRGFVESAGGGTLFLDEVGEIPLASQAKLLKFLEDGTIQPVGSAVARKVETRVVAATNRDLAQMMRAGTFRRDLYFRLATFPVEIPPLRAREDRAALLDGLVTRANRARGRPLRLSPACRAAILAHDFPGNLREMRSIVEYLDIVADETALPEHLPPAMFSGVPAAGAAGMGMVGAGLVGTAMALPPAATDEAAAPAAAVALPAPDATPAVLPPGPAESAEGASLKEMTRAFEDQVIQQALVRYGSKREAARHLGVDIATLVRKTTRPR
ncbi:sigma 54-interacting transcriptional regulator [Pseudoxanthobacter sp.]|uniref:sigma 54-interacting transcriptional regulator n=1 Tax=Pseudoxanthobacter sp. TaxID=1925742 RepID=UPI002FE3BB64